MTASRRRIAVVGGGISGLSAAWRASTTVHDVTVFEAGDRFGGKIAASPFAGLPAVDAGADAFLARVPEATALAAELGLGPDDLASPATGTAFVAHGGRLHPIPAGLVLGVPAGLGGLARSNLLSWPGKFRAALDVVLPRRSTDHDSLGTAIRERFGAEVLERLVDPLIGSINAGDSDRLSLRASTPQIAPVAEHARSLLLGLRKVPPGGRPSGPVFLTPTAGIAELPARLTDRLAGRGVALRLATPVHAIERHGAGVGLDGEYFDAVILASPAFAASSLLTAAAPEAAAGLRAIEYAGVVMVTLHVTDRRVLRALPAGSGYLVPKPDQLHVTAVSFATRKWAHWAPPGGGEVIRVSLGRLGNQAPLDFDDATCVTVAAKELAQHLGLRHEIGVSAARVTRWPRAFPQYAPHHLDRVAGIERSLRSEFPAVVLAGAGYHGIGIPACIRQATHAATTTHQRLAELPE